MGWDSSPIADFQRRAHGPQHRLVDVVLQITALAEHHHRACFTIKTPRPASVGQIETDEAYVMADGGQACQRINAILDLQIGIVGLEDVQCRGKHFVRARIIFVDGQ
jgi:hypothetical protein